MYELAEDIHLLALLPMREALSQYAKISEYHRNLASFYQKLDAEGTTRFLGRFFRVGFYGTHFADLNGREFVYRAPGAEHLFELKDKLVDYYSDRFGCPVDVAKDSGRISESTRELDTPLIQITSVRPMPGPLVGLNPNKPAEKYLCEWTNVSRFAFDTPFQKQGGAQAQSSADQWKRTTILEVRHPMPYVLQRQPVIDRTVFEVSPIELAIEALSTRISMISAESSKQVPNMQNLQQLLGGSVSVSVNSGPVEFCAVFLEADNSHLPEEHVAELKFAFREFLSELRTALDVMKAHMEPAMAAFHAQMEEDYSKLQSRLLPALVGELGGGGGGGEHEDFL